MTTNIERSSDGAEVVLVLSLTPQEFQSLRLGIPSTVTALRRAIREAEARD